MGSIPLTLLATRASGEALATLSAGTTVRVVGRLRPEAAGSQATAAIVVTAVRDKVAEPGPLDGAVSWLRDGLRKAAARLPPDQAGLVPSLVVGDRSAVDPALEDRFQAASLTHLMAVSGANLMLVLAVVIGLVRLLGVRGWAIRCCAAGAVAFFVVLCRAEPSVLRAAAMGLVTLPAAGLARGKRSVRNLSLAIITLTVLDPWLARSWGFALSAAACGGIVLVGQPTSAALARWLPDWLAEAIAIPLAAQIVALPLTTALSGEASLIGVLANVLAGPFVGPATVLGLVTATLSWWPAAANLAVCLAGWTVQPILAVAGMASALPAATIPWPTGAVGMIGGIAVAGALACVIPRLVAQPLTTLVLTLLLVAPNLLPRRAPIAWDAVFCDVGQGDMTVLRAGDGEAVVIDAAPEPQSALGCLDKLGVRRVTVLILTHFHADHVGGAAALLKRYRPSLVLVTRVASPPGAARAVREEATSAGSQVQVAEEGQTIAVGLVTWTTISAWETPVVDSEREGESSAENDASLVGIAAVSGVRILVAGDAEPMGQARALTQFQRLGRAPVVDVLKLPHHGSARQEPRLLAATQAKVAVASAGKGNSYGHPSTRTLRMVADLGMIVARTDQQGHILVAATPDGPSVKAWSP